MQYRLILSGGRGYRRSWNQRGQKNRYKTITAENPMYKKRIEEIMILTLTPNSLSCKFKRGQNLPQERKKLLLKYLEERGTSLDLLSANAIRQLS
ncbi:hypothetical protein [Sulfurospirillum diekertiae]|uniref:hypothetical protein n=1 Tax=Sulfurospirillum diekertiae TaxID=1854492 RepID=UPI0010FDFFB4|nr:hypothetical protein [Sulfurospirillum diekertiae]